MNNTRRLTFCAVMSALATAILFLTVFPYATYALAALAGMVLIPVALELGARYGVCCYVVTAVLSVLLTPDPEAKWLFVFFFGYYPILAMRLYLWRRRRAAWVVKFAVFNAAVLASYAVLHTFLHLDEQAFTIADVSVPIVFLALGNIVFLIYDICLVRVTAMYRVRLHPLVKRFL
ncbi:MAG: hypothetical protein IJC52_04965 [Clostridia bacterium]|nr:hypothetical protein [Clostridia bacterium]